MMTKKERKQYRDIKSSIERGMKIPRNEYWLELIEKLLDNLDDMEAEKIKYERLYYNLITVYQDLFSETCKRNIESDRWKSRAKALERAIIEISLNKVLCRYCKSYNTECRFYKNLDADEKRMCAGFEFDEARFVEKGGEAGE